MKKAKKRAAKASTGRVSYKTLHADVSVLLDHARYDLARAHEEIATLRAEQTEFLKQVADLAMMSADFENRVSAFRDTVTSLPGYNRILSPMGVPLQYATDRT